MFTLYMDKYLKSRLDSKLLDLPANLGVICRRKKIEVIDKETFALNNRRLILDYHFLTGDYQCFLGNLLKGKAILNENQLEEYQRKDFVRVNGNFTLTADDYLACSHVD